MILEHKTINLYKKMVFETATLTPPFRIPNHMTDEACFLYVIEGTQHIKGAISQLKIKAKEGVLMQCGSYYGEWLKATEYEKCQAIAVHFYPEILKKIYDKDYPDFIKQINKVEKETGLSKVIGDSTLHHYIASMMFYFENPALVSDELLVLKLKELILLLIKTENADSIKQLISRLFSPKEYDFKQVIEANIFTNLTIEELAKAANISASTFKREFNKHYNTSPALYFKTKKLEKAEDLLTSTENRISDIAYDCGFNDLAHFSKCFNEKYGASPSQYRSNLKTDIAIR